MSHRFQNNSTCTVGGDYTKTKNVNVYFIFLDKHYNFPIDNITKDKNHVNRGLVNFR